MKRKNVNTRKTKDEFIIEAIKIHGDRYNYDKVEYVKNRQNVKIICKEHGCFEQTPKSHLRGSNCPKCVLILNSSKRRLNQEEIIEKFKSKHGDKYNYDKVNYINFNTPVIITCKKHGDFKITPDKHMLYNCKKCYYETISKRLGTPYEIFLERANKVHNNSLYEYSEKTYINCSSKIEIICKKHGSFWQLGKKHIMGQGCPKCFNSRGESLILKFLNENKIDYIYHHWFPDCKDINPLPFDFYLPEHNICIEFDGSQHQAKDKGQSFFYDEKIKIHDEIKNKYCKNTNIELIRINYTVLNNIDKVLIKIFKSLKILSTEDKKDKFIEKSKELWGEKYDYSKVEYINFKTSVKIGYRNLFYLQTPLKHLQGKKIELQIKKLSNEQFIIKSKELWGNDRFNYSECEYLGTNNKVKLFDNFLNKWVEQVAKSHLKGINSRK